MILTYSKSIELFSFNTFHFFNNLLYIDSLNKYFFPWNNRTKVLLLSMQHKVIIKNYNQI